MLDELRAVLRDALGPTIYAAMWIICIAGAIRRAEWPFYLLIVLTPLPTVWYRLHQYPMGHDTLDLLVFASLLGIVLNKGGLKRAPAAGLVGSFILVSYLALWNATVRFDLPLPFSQASHLLVQWKNYFEMLILYFIAYNIARDEREQKTIVVLMASVFLLIVLREFRSFTERASFSYDHRAEGPFWIVGLGANHFGAFVAHYASVFLGLYFLDKHKYRKWIYLGGILFSVYPLFYSYSRGAYVAMLAALVVFGLVKKPSLLALVAALVIAWQAVLPPTVVERISMTETASSGGVEIEASAAHRLVLWEHAMQLFQDNMLFGVGFNAFGLTVPKGELTDTHNFYMKTAAEQGVVGLVLFAAIILRALFSAWNLYRQGHSAFYRGLGLGFFGCTVAVCVSNLFGDRWSYFMLGSYYWIFWGLIDRARQLTQQAPVNKPTANSFVGRNKRDSVSALPSPVTQAPRARV